TADIEVPNFLLKIKSDNGVPRIANTKKIMVKNDIFPVFLIFSLCRKYITFKL
ncbi:unnamed protein product, partial [marine sediment metagenome]